jgi:hypothetical protein
MAFYAKATPPATCMRRALMRVFRELFQPVHQQVDDA